MGHELSNTNGVYNFADSRSDAWHQLGQVVGHDMSADEALRAAHLADMNVRKVPLWADVRDDEAAIAQGVRGLAVDDHYAVIFDNPVSGKVQAMPATVGSKYNFAAAEALAQFGEAMVDQIGQACWQTVGSLRSYTQVFMTMLLPQTMVLEGLDGAQDVTKYYLALLNSYDGSTSLTGLITPVRIVCANTQSTAIHSAVSRFRIRHTAGWKDNLQEARKTLGLAFQYEAAFEAEARALFEQPFSVDEMTGFAHELVSVGKAKAEQDSAAATRRANEANSIVKLFVSSPTIAGTPVAATKYGAYNAVTEWIDHYAGTRGASDAAVGRATRTVSLAMGDGGMKTDAWRLLSV